MNYNHKSLGLGDDTRRGTEKNQSFSSTLLDAIYRSIDEAEDLRKNQQTTRTLKQKENYNTTWMENISQKGRKSAADFQRNHYSLFINSTSSSSDSSCGGGGGGVFSSSELDSSSSSSSRPKPIPIPIPIRTQKAFHNYPKPDKNQQKSKHEGGFVKTKSRALKIYGDLKKVKQPISPGGRLATFLNSLFTVKKAKSSSSSPTSYDDLSFQRKSKSAQTSTCSSASSFSRSCLSKNPSTKLKSSNGNKRSVHFYPVSSVIVDEPCSLQPNLREVKVVRSSMDEKKLKYHLEEKNRRAARDLYQKMSVEREFVMRNIDHINSEELEEDDGASCASSDLFELDNLTAIGMERYEEELPVYETTHFDTNRAIAIGSGMIM